MGVGRASFLSFSFSFSFSFSLSTFALSLLFSLGRTAGLGALPDSFEGLPGGGLFGFASVSAFFGWDTSLLPLPILAVAVGAGEADDAVSESFWPVTIFQRPEPLRSMLTSRVFFSSMFPNHRRNCR